MTQQAVHSVQTRPPALLNVALAIGVLFGFAFTAIGQFHPFGETEYTSANTLGWLISVSAIIVAAVITWQVARGPVNNHLTGPAAKRAVVLGGLAVLSFPAFWLGVYAPFAVGAVVLGSRASSAGRGGTRALGLVGMLLGALAVLFCTFLNVTG